MQEYKNDPEDSSPAEKHEPPCLTPEEGGAWACPTCGGSAVPPAWQVLRQEWSALSDREKKVAERLLTTHRLHGAPERSWNNAVWDMMRILLPSARDVDDIGDAHYFLPGMEDEPS